MRKVLLLVILLTGCATQTGVIPEGREAYLVILTSGGYGFSSSVDLKIEAHKEAYEYCLRLGKRPETVYEKNIPGGALSDINEEELKFKCVGEMNVASSSKAPAVPATLAPPTDRATPASSAVPVDGIAAP